MYKGEDVAELFGVISSIIYRLEDAYINGHVDEITYYQVLECLNTKTENPVIDSCLKDLYLQQK